MATYMYTHMCTCAHIHIKLKWCWWRSVFWTLRFLEVRAELWEWKKLGSRWLRCRNDKKIRLFPKIFTYPICKTAWKYISLNISIDPCEYPSPVFSSVKRKSQNNGIFLSLKIFYITWGRKMGHHFYGKMHCLSLLKKKKVLHAEWDRTGLNLLIWLNTNSVVFIRYTYLVDDLISS